MTKTRTGSGDINGFVDYPRFIKGTEFAALAREIDEKKVHVSLRSKGKVDVSEIAERFGGGGHFTASGFNMEGTLESVKTRLFQIADSVEKSSRL
ncbi:MAG: bifunctional oligoribonuclease/PAP phosphatase NrnA, partial [Deltaproteobacteria bacterium]|nr:bifunctional oligoribonuclease/PAP phosphatase NrnA [Deltaproteobacteria bacterium]